MYAANTDAQHLLMTKAPHKILLGRRVTRGLGAGALPQVGEEAAREAEEDLKHALVDADIVFVTCGLGGGTGTGSAPFVAQIAKEQGALTVAICTYPFQAEGAVRAENAEWGLERLRNVADTVIVIPNDRLLELVPRLSVNAAFKVADEVLMRSIKGITEVVTKPGLVNLDFNDIKTVMKGRRSRDDWTWRERRGRRCPDSHERSGQLWIAGLQLAALSLQSSADMSDFIAAFTGSQRYIVDYLVEEVLERQPESTQSFLLLTSILERMTGPLCDALTGRADGQLMLPELEQANLFVTALDHERRWYRYHQLFADVLRSRLRQTYPERLSELHRRAAGWHEQHGTVSEAISHALAGRDQDHVARLIEQNAMPMLMRGEVISSRF